MVFSLLESLSALRPFRRACPLAVTVFFLKRRAHESNGNVDDAERSVEGMGEERMIYEVQESSRNELSPLFSAHLHCRTTIGAVLEGQYGSVSANSLGRPSVAALLHGPTRILGGNAGHPDAPDRNSAEFRR